MDVRVDAEGPDAADRLRSLYGWLSDDQLLRGRLGLRERPPEPGTLGPVLEAVLVALGPGGAATALATGVIAWLRNRRGDVRLKVTLEDGRSLELTGKRVAGLDAAALRRQAADLAALLGQRDENPERRHLEPREHPEPREIPERGGHGDLERRDLS